MDRDHTDLQQALGPVPEAVTGHAGVKCLAFGLPEPQLVLLHAGVHLFEGLRPRALGGDHNVQCKGLCERERGSRTHCFQIQRTRLTLNFSLRCPDSWHFPHPYLIFT